MQKTCAVLEIYPRVEDVNLLIRRAETPVLLGLLCGYPADIIASAYGMQLRNVYRTAESVLMDLAKEHRVEIQQCVGIPDVHWLEDGAKRICRAVEAREQRESVMYYDLLTNREYIECEAIFPLFESFKRISTRLTEATHGKQSEVPSDSRA